jgi:hypothetical protein
MRKSRFTEAQDRWHYQGVGGRREHRRTLPSPWDQSDHVLQMESRFGGMEVSDVAKMRRARGRESPVEAAAGRFAA